MVQSGTGTKSKENTPSQKGVDKWVFKAVQRTVGDIKVSRVIKAKIRCIGPFDMPKGFKTYFTINPRTEETFIVEAKSGGIIGTDFAKVVNDIKSSQASQLRKEQKVGISQMKKAVKVSVEEFWQ